MPLRLISFTVLLAGLWSSLVAADDPSPPPCMMRPDHLQMTLPAQGFVWLEGEATRGQCDDVPAEKWLRNSSVALDLFVYADGPSGSGRFWNITIGAAQKRRSEAIRGVCLTSNTAGWRTLQAYKNTPLSWLDDLDKDGKAELIIWNSFPLRKDASLAKYGLVAWVYRLVSADSLAIDWDLSRQMAREIAKAYRAPLNSTRPYPGPLRTEAAEALERFADKRCSMPQNASGRGHE